MAYDKGISVIIPICNNEDYLKVCLNSVTRQSFKDLEIICVLDDKSDDGSEKILKNFAKEDKRVKIIRDTTGKGQGYNRNLGIGEVTKEYIGFVDADDYIEKDFYERLYDFGKNFNADIVQTDFIIKKMPEDTVLNESKCILNFEYSMPKICSVLKDRFCWDKIYKTELVKDNPDVRFLETTFYEDAYFVLKALSKSKKMVMVPGSKYYGVVCGESLSGRVELQGKHIDNANTVIKQIVDVLSRLNTTKSENRAIMKFFVEKFGAQAIQSDRYRDQLTRYIEKVIM